MHYSSGDHRTGGKGQSPRDGFGDLVAKAGAGSSGSPWGRPGAGALVFSTLGRRLGSCRGSRPSVAVRLASRCENKTEVPYLHFQSYFRSVPETFKDIQMFTIRNALSFLNSLSLRPLARGE